jgi:RNA polymerase sigma factor (sigma-70 family)
MENPFSVTNYSEHTDLELVQASVSGSRQALETLILRHQPFIYNVALKMTVSPADAEDITQEVLLKAITNLSQFQGKSAFIPHLALSDCFQSYSEHEEAQQRRNVHRF